MLAVRTRVRVSEDDLLEAKVPTALPAGDHEAVMAVEAQPERERSGSRLARFPIHDVPRPEDLSLRREEL